MGDGAEFASVAYTGRPRSLIALEKCLSDPGTPLTGGAVRSKEIDRQLRREYLYDLPAPPSSSFIADCVATTTGLYCVYPDLPWHLDDYAVDGSGSVRQLEPGSRRGVSGEGRVIGWRWDQITSVTPARGLWVFSGLHVTSEGGIMGFGGFGVIDGDLATTIDVRVSKSVATEVLLVAEHQRRPG